MTGLFTWSEPDHSGFTLLHYEVYLDDSYVNSTDDLFYQFEGLTSGMQYIAGVKAVYNEGESGIVTIQFTYQGVSIDGDLYDQITHLSCTPNPCKDGIMINFSLKEQAYCSLMIYNLKGQVVRTLINNEFLTNQQSIFWDGKDDEGLELTNGVYLYGLLSDNRVFSGKIIKIR